MSLSTLRPSLWLMAALVVLPLVTSSAMAAEPAQPPITIYSSIPAIVDLDLRSLPAPAAWEPDDPVYERLEDLEEDMQPATAVALARSRAFVDPLAPALGDAPVPNRAIVPGPTVNVPGGGFAGLYPPDIVGDAGPSHYIQSINASTIRIYDKSGTVVAGPFALDSLAPIGSICADGVGDPIILYDGIADRWMLSEFSGAATALCVYISQGSDPVTSGWFAYEFPTPSFPDYPKYAIWPDAYLATSFEGVLGAYALERTAMLAGNVATMQRFTVSQPGVVPGSGVRSTRLLAASVDGPPPPIGTPSIFFRPVESQQDNSNQVDRLEIYELDVDFQTPANSTFNLVQTIVAANGLADFGLVPCSPGVRDCIEQQGTASRLDALSGRPMRRLQYRNFGTHEMILTNESVNAGGRTGIRWWELRRSGGAWSIFQQGTYAPDAENRWMASMAMNGEGVIGLGYSLAGPNHFPSIAYTARSPSNFPGTFPNSEVVAVAGAGPQTAFRRWGDYSAMSVDPSDDAGFWYTNEYSTAGGPWATQVIAFGFSLEIFADSFEAGDTSSWSAAVP